VNTYNKLINSHIGENVFILGAGPSLWGCMSDPLFNKLRNYGITIAVNSAVIAMPKFDYWISNDALCRRWSWWKDVKNGSGIKIVRDSWLKYKDELDDFLFFSPRPTPEAVINSEDEGLAYCSSVPSAVDLAIQMGCKNIFLLGVDHTDLNGKHHFWQFMEPFKMPKAHPPAQGPWNQQRSVFKINMLAFNALKEFADSKNVDIYNVSDISKIDIFKIINMGEIYAFII
jgi:hypothetical protein